MKPSEFWGVEKNTTRKKLHVPQRRGNRWGTRGSKKKTTKARKGAIQLREGEGPEHEKRTRECRLRYVEKEDDEAGNHHMALPTRKAEKQGVQQTKRADF